MSQWYLDQERPKTKYEELYYKILTVGYVPKEDRQAVLSGLYRSVFFATLPDTSFSSGMIPPELEQKLNLKQKYLKLYTQGLSVMFDSFQQFIDLPRHEIADVIAMMSVISDSENNDPEFKKLKDTLGI